ncbi:unnamed protein product [Staurois parvus]|uniref:Uncharacterized protein n=1 Tax=Staurois parvus TaxID=386267 RepID=A0ABN9BPM6_9NEOB|nr:unnamed protein product [Staurois parvus]
MGTAGVQTQELSTGMVGTPPNGQSRYRPRNFLIMGAAGVHPRTSAHGW